MNAIGFFMIRQLQVFSIKMLESDKIRAMQLNTVAFSLSIFARTLCADETLHGISLPFLRIHTSGIGSNMAHVLLWFMFIFVWDLCLGRTENFWHIECIKVCSVSMKHYYEGYIQTEIFSLLSICIVLRRRRPHPTIWL